MRTRKLPHHYSFSRLPCIEAAVSEALRPTVTAELVPDHLDSPSRPPLRFGTALAGQYAGVILVKDGTPTEIPEVLSGQHGADLAAPLSSPDAMATPSEGLRAR